jgi:hypothetical protein
MREEWSRVMIAAISFTRCVPWQLSRIEYKRVYRDAAILFVVALLLASLFASTDAPASIKCDASQRSEFTACCCNDSSNKADLLQCCSSFSAMHKCASRRKSPDLRFGRPQWQMHTTLHEQQQVSLCRNGDQIQVVVEQASPVLVQSTAAASLFSVRSVSLLLPALLLTQPLVVCKSPRVLDNGVSLAGGFSVGPFCLRVPLMETRTGFLEPRFFSGRQPTTRVVTAERRAIGMARVVCEGCLLALRVLCIRRSPRACIAKTPNCQSSTSSCSPPMDLHMSRTIMRDSSIRTIKLQRRVETNVLRRVALVQECDRWDDEARGGRDLTTTQSLMARMSAEAVCSHCTLSSLSRRC